MPASLQVVDFKKTYRCRQAGEKDFTLVIPSLELHERSVNLFVGESGCGKSTLLDALGLISRADEAGVFRFRRAGGEALEPCSEREGLLSLWRRKHIGYVLQTGGLLRFMTVRDNLLFRLSLAGVSLTTEEKNSRVESLADELGIVMQLQKWPEELSIGQRQRVAIASALIHDPEFVLADEPTGALDSISAGKVMTLLLEHARQRGAITLIVSHDKELFYSMADRRWTFRLAETEKEILSTVEEI